MQQSGLLIGVDGYDIKLLRVHAKLLAEQLKSSGYNVSLVDFTQRNHPSAYFRREYESGAYTHDNLYEPYSPTTFYALHHFAYRQAITEQLNTGDIVICIGYVVTNILLALHKTPRANGIPSWIENLEHDMYSLPKSDVSLALLEATDQYFTHIDTLCRGPVQSIAVQDSVTSVSADLRSALQPYLKTMKPGKRGGLTTIDLPETESNELPPNSTADSREKTLSMSTVAYLELLLIAQHQNITIHETASGHGVYTPDLKDKKHGRVFSDTGNRLLQIAERVSGVDTTTADLMRPLSQMLTVKITIDNDALLVLSTSDNPELQQTAKELGYTDSGRVDDTVTHFLEKHDLLPLMGSEQHTTLLWHYPKNELDAVADYLYPATTLSSSDLRTKLDEISYTERVHLLEKTGIQPSSPSYKFEFLTTVSELIAVAELGTGYISSQKPTPQYGFDALAPTIEQIIEDQYDTCFADSFALYSQIQAVNPDSASYATLRGHKIRWTLRLHWHELKDLLSQSRDKSLINDMIQQVSSVHPILSKRLTTNASD